MATEGEGLDLDRVIKRIRGRENPDEPVIIGWVAKELFDENIPEAKAHITALLERGDLERVGEDIQLAPLSDGADASASQQSNTRANQIAELRAFFGKLLGDRGVGVRDSVLGTFVDAGLTSAEEIAARIGRHSGIVPAALKEAGIPINCILEEELKDLSAHDEPWLRVAAEAAWLLSGERAQAVEREEDSDTLEKEDAMPEQTPWTWENILAAKTAKKIGLASREQLIAALDSEPNRDLSTVLFQLARSVGHSLPLGGWWIYRLKERLSADGVHYITRTEIRQERIKDFRQKKSHQTRLPRPKGESTPKVAPSTPAHPRGQEAATLEYLTDGNEGPEAERARREAASSAAVPAVRASATIPAVVPESSDLAQGMMAMLASASAGQGAVVINPAVDIAARVNILMAPLSMQASQLARLPVAMVVRKALAMIAADRPVAEHIQSQPALQAIMEANRLVAEALDRLAKAE
ncbi:MAG: hypothetical protein A3H70_02170 [Candidatus Komeilibacteria bacterium RIFCSPLOWO2_02_FULL_48_11]|uniref:Uncharacterized protein n=1 Tax=Candidatus Komeilibacteria bacterium RIFCSPLOWO2_02_FULL_48_11 TaxID=1798553 RepID=A0A1G2BSE2_9BACT|nr:MAG: hypothetical protein A3H70_02170 [Candidatus Komeilibacteria bacterium RIFCSPLOWO2_02_FULL_48_11]